MVLKIWGIFKKFIKKHTIKKKVGIDLESLSKKEADLFIQFSMAYWSILIYAVL